MKKESIIISVHAFISLLPRKYPEWFLGIDNDDDKIKLSTHIVDAFILNHIDMITRHPNKLYQQKSIPLSNGEMMEVDMEMVLSHNVEDIFPNMQDLYEFVYDYGWHIYEVIPSGHSRVIIRHHDWRVAEYYRLTRKDDDRSICMDEWSNDYGVINDFIRGQN